MIKCSLVAERLASVWRDTESAWLIGHERRSLYRVDVLPSAPRAPCRGEHPTSNLPVRLSRRRGNEMRALGRRRSTSSCLCVASSRMMWRLLLPATGRKRSDVGRTAADLPVATPMLQTSGWRPGRPMTLAIVAASIQARHCVLRACPPSSLPSSLLRGGSDTPHRRRAVSPPRAAGREQRDPPRGPSATRGSLLTLKVRTRCGFKPCD